MNVGVQLFGLLYNHDIDVFDALRALRDMGYARVEPCVCVHSIEGLERPAWTVDWLCDNAARIAAMGLEIVSCHVFSDDIAAEAPSFARLAAHGVRQFVVKSPSELTSERLQETSINYMRAADIMNEVGAALLIHNEEADIRAKVGEKTAFEHLLDLCLGRVYAQVDIGWVLAGGEDPVALLKRNARRVRAMHFKDFVREGEALVEVASGQGIVDTAACFRFARAFGCTQVVDMDRFPNGWQTDLAVARNALDALKDSRYSACSYLNTLDTETGAIRTLAKFEGVIEAPNWLKRSNRLLYNANGLIYTYDLDTGEVSRIDTGICDSCNNDHVMSPDETEIAVSHMTFGPEGFTSHVYVVPMTGGAPRKVTENTPCFLHGWSPDGKEFAYCAFREIDGRREVNVYTIPVEGGEEKRLTGGGFNDGPEYSPDGQYIWYNSTKSGLMQIWRMRANGSEQTQMTHTARNNWFGHISPDAKKVAWLSYGKDDLKPDEHLPEMAVELWLMNADGSEPHRIATLFGGQGSMNVNSWAGDSRHLAFVSYEIL